MRQIWSFSWVVHCGRELYAQGLSTAKQVDVLKKGVDSAADTIHTRSTIHIDTIHYTLRRLNGSTAQWLNGSIGSIGSIEPVDPQILSHYLDNETIKQLTKPEVKDNVVNCHQTQTRIGVRESAPRYHMKDNTQH